MKKDNVPQDKSTLVQKNLNEICYATDEKGNYTTVLSTGWDAKIIALDESMKLVNERVQEAREKVQKAELSPIAYYMEVNKMDISVLASYTKIWSWFIKRHLNSKHFNGLKRKTLQKYADAFDITIEELQDIEKHIEKK